jgi:NDP-sugar pyrophosphorylase family protein
MNIIIPMAGSGQRFVNAGYKEPKPLIKVGGRMIIEYVLDMFDRENDNFLFICNDNHLDDTFMREILEALVAKATIIGMPPHKLGPVYTVLAVENLIPDEEPCIIAYCDNPVTWDYEDFKKAMRLVDGCIVSHTGFHPHTLSNTLFAYSKTDKVGWVSEIKEKACYTNNRFAEHASSGIYYFRYGHLVKKYFKQAINENLNYKGEYYVTLVYNLLIKDGLRVFSYLNDKVLAFGTPREVQNYEAWQTIIKGGQVHSEEEAKLCYNYWNGAH